MNYKTAKQVILQKLRQELDGNLSYHGLHHTLDVLAVTKELCILEHVNDYETTLLKTAALFHDAGFIISKNGKNHEAIGCDIAREILPKHDYNDAEIDAICGMIMATKIPQTPYNRLEEIICDADLDYLGRTDFYHIGNTLFEELKKLGVLDNDGDWNKLQVNFLTAHRFFTQTNIDRREPQKQRYLKELKELVATYE